MTSTEIIVVVGGLLLGYWIVATLFNKKPVSSTANSNSSAENGAQDNRSHTEESDNDESCKEESIPTSWFRILEVSQSATKEQIVAAYKQKIRQYHPDKVAQMGAEIRELAEFKSKEINAAYDYAMKQQG